MDPALTNVVVLLSFFLLAPVSVLVISVFIGTLMVRRREAAYEPMLKRVLQAQKAAESAQVTLSESAKYVVSTTSPEPFTQIDANIAKSHRLLKTSLHLSDELFDQFFSAGALVEMRAVWDGPGSVFRTARKYKASLAAGKSLLSRSQKWIKLEQDLSDAIGEFEQTLDRMASRVRLTRSQLDSAHSRLTIQKQEGMLGLSSVEEILTGAFASIDYCEERLAGVQISATPGHLREVLESVQYGVEDARAGYDQASAVLRNLELDRAIVDETTDEIRQTEAELGKLFQWMATHNLDVATARAAWESVASDMDVAAARLSLRTPDAFAELSGRKQQPSDTITLVDIKSKQARLVRSLVGLRADYADATEKIQRLGKLAQAELDELEIIENNGAVLDESRAHVIAVVQRVIPQGQSLIASGRQQNLKQVEATFAAGKNLIEQSAKLRQSFLHELSLIRDLSNEYELIYRARFEAARRIIDETESFGRSIDVSVDSGAYEPRQILNSLGVRFRNAVTLDLSRPIQSVIQRSVRLARAIMADAEKTLAQIEGHRAQLQRDREELQRLHRLDARIKAQSIVISELALTGPLQDWISRYVAIQARCNQWAQLWPEGRNNAVKFASLGKRALSLLRDLEQLEEEHEETIVRLRSDLKSTLQQLSNAWEALDSQKRNSPPSVVRFGEIGAKWAEFQRLAGNPPASATALQKLLGRGRLLSDELSERVTEYAANQEAYEQACMTFSSEEERLIILHRAWDALVKGELRKLGMPILSHELAAEYAALHDEVRDIQNRHKDDQSKSGSGTGTWSRQTVEHLTPTVLTRARRLVEIRKRVGELYSELAKRVATLGALDHTLGVALSMLEAHVISEAEAGNTAVSLRRSISTVTKLRDKAKESSSYTMCHQLLLDAKAEVRKAPSTEVVNYINNESNTYNAKNYFENSTVGNASAGDINLIGLEEILGPASKEATDARRVN